MEGTIASHVDRASIHDAEKVDAVRLVGAGREWGVTVARRLNNPELANWAATKGLQSSPARRGMLKALHRIQMQAASIAGNPQGIDDAYRAATRSAEALSPWDDLQPETEELYAKLTRRAPGRDAVTSG